VDAIHFPQPALWALQQPHKHSHSLQLANHTQLAHHYFNGFFSFKSKRISPKYQATTSKHRPATSNGR